MEMATGIGGDGSLDKELKTCTVLGGRGFVGRALVEMLLRLGNWIVRVADSSKSAQLKPYESLLADAFSTARAVYFQVDVCHKSQIIEALQGVSVVFYCDSVTLDQSPPDFYSCYQIIVQGAKNVVNACRECKVNRLIYNSSASVVFDDAHDICGGDESVPYSGRVWDMVTDLRTQAEALILSANDSVGLLTCALRPCNVFGPGDQHLLPLLVNIAKSNWTKFIIGSGKNLSDFTHVDNVAHAHICAEESLSSLSSSGKAYFITNMEPMRFWEFATLLLEGLGYYRPIVSLPLWVVNCALFLTKLLHVKLESGKRDPCVAVYNVVALASHTRTFNCSAAQKHIHYSPIVSMDEAVKSTVDSFTHLSMDCPLMMHKDFREPSKVEKLLGNGAVADVLLWRDEMKTFLCFLLCALLYQLFFLSGSTFISSIANMLLLTVLLLCGHHILLLTGYGSTIPRLSASCFEISEVDMRNAFSTLKCMWNKINCLTRSLSQGEDWHTFLKVSAFLYICKRIVPDYLNTAVGLALILSFTLCFVYEQYEEKIDGVAVVVFSIASNISIFIARKLPKPFGSMLPTNASE